MNRSTIKRVALAGGCCVLLAAFTYAPIEFLRVIFCWYGGHAELDELWFSLAGLILALAAGVQGAVMIYFRPR